MADRMRVSTEQLKKTADRFSKEREKMEETCRETAGTARGTQEYWRGPAGEAFLNRFSAMEGELMKTDRRVQDAVDGLLKAAGIFEDSEKETSGKAQSLDTGLSPFL